jgi:hypothetical protein
MKRTTFTTGTALVLSLAGLTAANAATLNTVPLNAQGKQVSSTPVVYGGTNTTINSSVHPFVIPNYNQPNITINSSVHPFVTPNYNQSNTTISSSLNVPKTVVTTAAQNTTIGSSLNVPKTVVTSAGGLSAITYGTFSVPNVKAATPTGTLTAPKQVGSYYSIGGDTGLGDAATSSQNIGSSSSTDAINSLTDLQTVNQQVINIQMQANTTQQQLQQSQIQTSTQSQIFSILQDTSQNKVKTADKSAGRADDYIRN